MAAPVPVARPAPGGPPPFAAFAGAGCDGFLAGLLVGSHAAALLDDAGRVLRLSEGGHGVLAPTLEVRNGRLLGLTRDAGRQIGRLLDGLRGGGPAGPVGLAILAAPCGATLLVRGRRIADGFLLPQVAAAVTFLDPAACALPDAALLHGAFGLTTSEAAVALGIAAGQDPRQIAAARGVAVQTVRSHLKRVFGKTGTHRQSALVALLLSLQTPRPPDGGRRAAPRLIA